MHNAEGTDSYKILGCTVLDYQELYKKFSPDKHESYRLDYIAEQEEVGRKITYEEYGNSLMRLYRGEWDIDPSRDPETLSKKDRMAQLRTRLKARLAKRGILDRAIA